MFQQPWYVTILPVLPILLAHLAGIVVAVILLVRHGGTPAILALIGFGVLFVADLAGFAGGPLVGLLASQTRQFLIANVGVGCCCSVLDVVAIVCLIVAIWQAVSGAAAGETVEEIEEAVEEVVGVLEEAPEETARATRVLEETLEGTVETSEEAVEEGAGTPE
jgi:hypothetical protein